VATLQITSKRGTFGLAGGLARRLDGLLLLAWLGLDLGTLSPNLEHGVSVLLGCLLHSVQVHVKHLDRRLHASSIAVVAVSNGESLLYAREHTTHAQQAMGRTVKRRTVTLPTHPW
jgi:hypothetical protein